MSKVIDVVYVGYEKFYKYPYDWACKPSHEVACRRCAQFGGYTDDDHFLCRQYWQKKVL